MGRSPTRMVLATLAVALFAGRTQADLITNGGLELGSPLPPAAGSSLPVGSTVITGWTVVGSNGGHDLAWLPNGNNYGVSTPYGNYFADLTGYTDAAPYDGLTQTISTTPGQSYTLAFALGTDQSIPVYSGPISVLVSAGSVSNQVVTDSTTGTGNIWTPFSLSFTASTSSTAVTIVGNSSAGGQYIGLDNISVNPASVPEPGSLLLGAVAVALGLGYRMARGRSRSA